MGSNADSDRIAAMIRSNLDRIDEIYVTLDSHHVSSITKKSTLVLHLYSVLIITCHSIFLIWLQVPLNLK